MPFIGKRRTPEEMEDLRDEYAMDKSREQSEPTWTCQDATCGKVHPKHIRFCDACGEMAPEEWEPRRSKADV